MRTTGWRWYGVSIDIDDQVRAEKALRRREQQLREFIDAVPVQIWSVTARGEPAYMNKTMLDYMGVRLEDYDVSAVMADVVRTFHPADQAAILTGMSHSVRTGEPFEMKYRCRRWDGEYRWMQGRAVPLRDGSGRINRWYGVNLDIHDMLTTQEELREREEELSLLVDMAPVLIGRLDANGEPTFFSRRAAEAIGLENSENGSASRSGSRWSSYRPTSRGRPAYRCLAS
jgi:PAS domain S-box-containing protein